MIQAAESAIFILLRVDLSNDIYYNYIFLFF